ncbi:MAG TPA: hypothetical protein VK203_10745 [Nostocaceae cyanobacterium]|nr:hypothetical protein [Nostocaceae cyanobacterium]
MTALLEVSALALQTTEITPGINIWSGSRDMLGLGAALTNPTEISFRKGNIQHHYPVTFNGVTYVDLEAAFQANRYYVDYRDEWLMKVLMIEKLGRNEKLFNAIAENGGVEWLKHCSHIVPTASRHDWEGYGLNSRFIKCLALAYEIVAKLKEYE